MKFSIALALFAPLLAAAAPADGTTSPVFPSHQPLLTLFSVSSDMSEVSKRCTTRQEVESVWHESGLSRRRVRAWADGADHMQFCDIWNTSKFESQEFHKDNLLIALTECGQSRGVLINCQCWESDEDPKHAILDISTALGPAGDNTFNNAKDSYFKLFTGRLGCDAA